MGRLDPLNSEGSFAGTLRRVLFPQKGRAANVPIVQWLAFLDRQHNMLICQALRETGATGLEPATSGVTDQQSVEGELGSLTPSLQGGGWVLAQQGNE